MLLVANLGLLAFYEFSTFKYDVHSDSAVKVLLAEEVLRTREFFPHEWVYANADIYAFSPHTLALALVPIFGAGYTTHALVGLLIGLMLLAATGALLRELGYRRWQLLLMLALLAGGSCSLMAETLYGQAVYGFIIMMNAAVLAFALAFARRFADPGVRRWVWLVVFALLSCLASINNPKRTAAMLTLPLLVAAAVLVVRANGNKVPRLATLRASPWAWLVGAHLAGFGVAFVFATRALARVHSVDMAALTTWLAPDGIWRNATYAVLGVLAHLGGVPQAGGPVATGWGAYDVFRMVIAVPVLWAAIKAVRLVMRAPEGPRGFIAVFATASGALSLLFFVFTTLPDPTSPLPSARYLMPAFFCALVLVPVLLAERPTDGDRPTRALAFSLTAIACCGVTALALPGYGGNGARWKDALRRGNERLELIDRLEKQGLSYGYATYWNAGALTLLSEGRVKVRQISSDAVPMPMRVHATNRWFHPEEWTGKETFLLLTDAELKRVDRPLLDARLGQPLRSFWYNEFRVLVYGNNLALLPGWNDVTDGLQRFAVNPSSLHRVGRFVDQGNGQGVLSSAVTESGELLFGPYLTLNMGHYKVTFDVGAEGPATGAMASLQVTSRQNTNQLATVAFPAGPRTTKTLEFDVFSEEKSVEFRVVTTGAGAVTVYGTTLERVPTER